MKECHHALGARGSAMFGADMVELRGVGAFHLHRMGRVILYRNWGMGLALGGNETNKLFSCSSLFMKVSLKNMRIVSVMFETSSNKKKMDR